MLTRIALIVGCLIAADTINAQETFPARKLGFLKAGQYIRLMKRDGQGRGLTVIGTKENWEIARDAQAMSLADLRKKYPAVEMQAANLIANQAKQKDDGSTSSDTSKLIVLSGLSSYEFGKIVHVGEDYILVESPKGRTVYSLENIDTIDWDQGDLLLSIPTDLRGVIFTGPSTRKRNKPEPQSH